jgi:hypothetical protein
MLSLVIAEYQLRRGEAVEECAVGAPLYCGTRGSLIPPILILGNLEASLDQGFDFLIEVVPEDPAAHIDREPHAIGNS